MKMKSLFVCILLLNVSSVFAQRTLQEYIQLAKTNSPLIHDNLAQQAVNKTEVLRLKAFYTKAQIGVTASYLFSPIISRDGSSPSFQANPESATNYSGYDLAYSNGGTYQAMLTITQPLFNGKQYKAASDLVLSTSQIAENAALINAHDLEKVIADQYILCVQGLRQLQYTESMLDILSNQRAILEKLVQNSIYKPSELTLLSIDQQTQRSQKTTYTANYLRDLFDLRILSGVNDTSYQELIPSDLALNTARETSHFLEKYKLDSSNLIAQQNSFETKYLPQISLFGNTGLNAVYAPTIPSRIGFSAGLSLSYPLSDGGQKKLNREKTSVQQNAVAFNRGIFESQNQVRKAKILNELASYAPKIEIAEQQLKDYQTLLESYKKEILSGQLTIINYLSVLKNMAAVQRDYILLYSQQQTLINAYNYWNW